MTHPTPIRFEQNQLIVPDYPIIPFIEGDGIGQDITPAMIKVVDQAVNAAYQDQKKIEWQETLAGEKAFIQTGHYLPASTLGCFRDHIVGIKGPLSTSIGSGFRSLNVTLRQVLDLYSCIRPFRWYGSASPLKNPSSLDLVIFRENIEDVYAGVEYKSGSQEAKQIIELIYQWGVSKQQVEPNSAIGLKPISPKRTKRHVRKALRWAMEHDRKIVTFMHKGNIMKFTEGDFKVWGYDVLCESEFLDYFVEESQQKEPDNKIRVNHRLADNMFYQVLARPEEYDLIITPNLNGDYLSGAAAAIVGGPGLAPSANIGEGLAIFESCHGSAPKYAGQDKANPTSLILSAAMMLDYLGWNKAADMIRNSLRKTLDQRVATYDLIRGWRAEGEQKLEELSCSEFASTLGDNI
jgi:isocitrate dehydrogenase